MQRVAASLRKQIPRNSCSYYISIYYAAKMFIFML